MGKRDRVTEFGLMQFQVQSLWQYSTKTLRTPYVLKEAAINVLLLSSQPILAGSSVLTGF
jgi:hypothetical protein